MIMEKPDLGRGLELYMDAFEELSTCRGYPFEGCGPIPWDAIVRYADRLELIAGDARRFLRMIRSLDDEFLRWMREKRKSARDNDGNAP